MPLTLDEYSHWHFDHLGEDLSSEDIRRRYAANITLAQAGVADHAFIKDCLELLRELAGQKLFAMSSGDRAPDFSFVTKPYDSVIDKTYRVNCNWNRAFPRRPADGWTTASNWFSKFDDLVRTTLVCRYLDGPEIVCKALKQAAEGHKLEAAFEPRATNDGYYAFHFYARIPVSLMTLQGKIHDTTVEVEVQVTTQLQEVLRDLTHPLYRAERVGVRRPSPIERWDFGTSKFRASYLAHTLHLIEGMIVQLRNEVPDARQATVEQASPEA
jgi:ppGpp synthetase/RelA/SpoT-type nucleotidyltranferase